MSRIPACVSAASGAAILKVVPMRAALLPSKMADHAGTLARQVVLAAAQTVASAAGLQREYDADGNLLEVRSRTAILGNWAGGRM